MEEIKISEKRFIQLLGYEKEFNQLGVGSASRDELCKYIDSLELSFEKHKGIISDLLEALIELQNDVESWNNLFESDRIRITNAINKATK